MTPSRVGVPIPAREATATLRDAVRSALEEGVGAIVIAVDPVDRPTACLAARLAAEDDRVSVVANPPGTTPAGLNRAIAALTQPVIARLDAHTRFAPGYVRTGLSTLASTGSAVVGGRQLPVGESRLQRAFGAAMASPVGAGGARHHVGGPQGPSETAYLGMFDRRWILAVGGYDETLERNQDYELCHRIGRAGGLVWFTPELVATYHPRASWTALARQFHDYGRWKRVVMQRAPRSIRPRQLAAPMLVAALAGSLAAGLAGRRRWWVLPAAYAAGVSVAAGVARHPDGSGLTLPERVAMAGALVTMHLSWGTGFWRGRRSPAQPRLATSR